MLRPRYPIRTTACSLTAGFFLLLQSAQAAFGWAVFRGDQGTSVPYPEDVFTVRSTERETPGDVFTTADGRARLHIFARQNERYETPAQFIRRVIVDDR